MNLYHYYEKNIGAFRNLSDLTYEDAESLLQDFRTNSTAYVSKREAPYMKRRLELETMARKMFIEKGGKPLRIAPHYMVVEECAWLESWYKEGKFVKIPIEKFDVNTISFTYGDMFPTFSPRCQDGKEYREKIYTYTEIVELIEKYGLPQLWNNDGRFGPERYIEVQVWSDEPLHNYY